MSSLIRTNGNEICSWVAIIITSHAYGTPVMFLRIIGHDIIIPFPFDVGRNELRVSCSRDGNIGRNSLRPYMSTCKFWFRVMATLGAINLASTGLHVNSVQPPCPTSIPPRRLLGVQSGLDTHQADIHLQEQHAKHLPFRYQ